MTEKKKLTLKIAVVVIMVIVAAAALIPKVKSARENAYRAYLMTQEQQKQIQAQTYNE